MSEVDKNGKINSEPSSHAHLMKLVESLNIFIHVYYGTTNQVDYFDTWYNECGQNKAQYKRKKGFLHSKVTIEYAERLMNFLSIIMTPHEAVPTHAHGSNMDNLGDERNRIVDLGK